MIVPWIATIVGVLYSESQKFRYMRSQALFCLRICVGNSNALNDETIQ